jgi:hypothetical protein
MASKKQELEVFWMWIVVCFIVWVERLTRACPLYLDKHGGFNFVYMQREQRPPCLIYSLQASVPWVHSFPSPETLCPLSSTG